MNVAVWEAGDDAVVYGPFPEGGADEWLYGLGVLIDADQVRAGTAVVNPAYDLRAHIPDGLGDAQSAGVLIHRGSGLDSRAYGFVARLLECDRARGLAGVWRSRDDAAAWWAAQDGALTLGGVTHVEVLPVLAVPGTVEHLILNHPAPATRARR